MKRKVPSLAIPLISLITLSLPSVTTAGVYVSYDSLQPSYEQKLAEAQLQALHGLTDKIQNQNDINEFYAANIIEFNKTQQELTNAQRQKLSEERYLIEQQRQRNDDEARALILARSSLEQQRLNIVRDATAQESQLLAQAVQQEKDFFEKQSARENDFLATQQRIQEKSLALQADVSSAQNRLLEDQLKKDAPSNLIVASSDASNMKQVVNPKMVEAVHALGKAEQKNVVVNLNEFISTILPPTWHYQAPEGLDSETINAVQGKDWQSILNLIAVNNPHLEIVVDPYKKSVVVRNTMHAFKTNKVNRNTPYTTWHISTNRTMRQNIDAFAKQADWRLIWDTKEKDYETVAPAVIRARFAGEDGVVQKLIDLTKEKDVELEADFRYGNRVVIVTRKGAKTK